ncbi:multiprotein bridging factor 1 [Rhizoctonia solani]|uniref:Multiprotein bridging factor 1 n=1 Tax=Rhizoctonia solani TaxID=456999 RepID=A0A8H8NSW0_9AGAM|nr:multiprotein bridging factor 1 [Rhizoctonia solani]QRW18157.1 multiprotein bridging factor 1 [Rhizoctonia solani]
MSDADWDTKVVIGNKARTPKVTKGNAEVNAARRAGAIVSTDKKSTASNKGHVGPDHQKIAKLDRENDVAPPSKVAPSVGKAMQTARMELKLSQKDVAAKINEKQSVLQDYESGKAIPNPRFSESLSTYHPIGYSGSDIGKKLEGPKKST